MHLPRSEVCLQQYIKGLQSNLSKLEELDVGITIGFPFTIFPLVNSVQLFQFSSFWNLKGCYSPPPFFPDSFGQMKTLEEKVREQEIWGFLCIFSYTNNHVIPRAIHANISLRFITRFSWYRIGDLKSFIFEFRNE